MPSNFQCSPFFAALLSFLIAFSPGCSKQGRTADSTISVDSDDTEMNAAIAQARNSLPEFWRVFETRARGEYGFALKVKISDHHRVEHFWLISIERQDGKIFGTVNNDPDIVKNVKLGDRLVIPESDISDWLYLRDGKMVGNYTLKVLFKQMPAAEVEKYKKMMSAP